MVLVIGVSNFFFDFTSLNVSFKNQKILICIFGISYKSDFKINTVVVYSLH